MITGSVTLVSTNSLNQQGNGDIWDFTFSPDSKKLLFSSYSSNLVPNDNNGLDVFLKDLETGAITLVSANSSGTQGDGASHHAAFSPDGTKVVFDSMASNFSTIDTDHEYDIFIKDLQTGAIALASTNELGEQAHYSSLSSFSPDGKKILFRSAANNLAENSTNGFEVYSKDLETGKVTLISTNKYGESGNQDDHNAAYSPDGTKIIFETHSSNLVADDYNDKWDIYIATPFGIYGGPSSETINGTASKDIIFGYEGNDIINGLAGDDFIYGGLGSDTIDAGQGSDFIDGGLNPDVVRYINSSEAVHINLNTAEYTGGDATGDRLYNIEDVWGSNFDDTLIGDNNKNNLQGENGDDFLQGLGGNDILGGGTGNDILEGGAGADIFYGGGGKDTASYEHSEEAVNIDFRPGPLGGQGNTGGEAQGDAFWSIEIILGSSYDDKMTGYDNNTFHGGQGNDELIANFGDNYLYGDSGNDTLRGGVNNNHMYGGADDDVLYANVQGQDTLYGDGGADTFVFDAAAGNYYDRIMEFNVTEGDKIDISNILIGYDPLTDAITDFVQITEQNVFGGIRSVLSVDADGGGDHFALVATIYATGLTDEDALEASGNLITV